MSTGKRRGGYLATAEGVKRLKEAKRQKKYTYENIKNAAHVTLDQVKRLFNPQWGNGKYKIGEDAVSLICGVLELQPEEIVSDWHVEEIKSDALETSPEKIQADTPYAIALQAIERAAREGAKELVLSGLELAELPIEIGQLNNLCVLNLGSNNLTTLPPEIGQLNNLSKLYLSRNNLSNLPIEIGKLNNLSELYLDKNNLTTLPPEIGQLNNLSKLSLNTNNLSSFPIEIGQLNNLSKLSLNENNFTSFPIEIRRLNNLLELYFNRNNFTSFRIENGHFNKLLELHLSGNNLSNLPTDIGNINNLSELHLSGNNLSNLPAEIGQLAKLSILHVNRNKLSSLPPQIGQLDSLLELSLSENNINSLPAEVGQLAKLSILRLNKNNLTSLPTQIGQLTNLSELSLTKNNLTNLPTEIGQLTKLTELYLSRNKLSSLPAKIGQLAKLLKLSLSGNSLNSLPHTIEKLDNLSELHLSDNPLSIPPEITQKWHEPATIIDYYLSLQNSEKSLHEAKMLLVGEANVGKTCVKERLLRNQYDPTRNKTDGIDIEPWNVKIKDNKYQVNVWDFGGQEIDRSTHQFFLTKRSLYLLVLDTTRGEEQNRIEYWLKIIESFGKDSPVIIVGNKAEQHPLDIDREGLKHKYKQIKGIHEVSCQESTGFENLSAKITEEIGNLEHIDDALPSPWYNVKQKLEALDKDYIPFERYEAICEKEGISKEDNQHTLIRLLNDLGVVLNFNDDPRLEDTHVLNPEWVTNGVYKIINDPPLIRDHKGILELKMLSGILQKSRYPRGKQMFIIDMMRKFELCFDIETNKRFLIPDLLPKNEPDTGNWDNTLAFEYHYPVYINSIISRFIVRMHEWISKSTYWRTGVVLAKEGNRALVKADREDKKIMIRVDGNVNTRRNLLTAIRSDFEYIHSTIPGIKPKEKVPLLNYADVPPVDYQWLIDLDLKNVRTTYVPELTEEIDIRQLLNGIASEIDRYRLENKEGDFKRVFKSDRHKIKNLPPKPVSKEVFISYSWAQESKEITDKIDKAFENKGITILRDTRELGYKDRIKAFMQNIGRGKCVIVVVSKGYLQSANCMFELLEIFKQGEFSERIFPIVLPDAKIYKPIDRIKYVRYWEQEVKELDEAMKTVSAANLQGFTDDINFYTEIRHNLPQLMTILKDINALSIKIHTESEFTAMIAAVERKLQE